MLLGCIADDFTGATDLASMLVRGGMRTVQTIGVPADAPLAAGRGRGGRRAQVAHDSGGRGRVAVARRARAGCATPGARQIYFKYCSTFDSTPAGNIGPVADALMDALGADFTIACPAFPENGRTIYKGHLFVGDVLLSESAMRDHPLTPMTDANLVRVLARADEAQGRARRAQDRARAAPPRSAPVSTSCEPAAPAYAIVDALADERSDGDRRGLRRACRSSRRAPASRSGCRRTSSPPA